MERARLLIEQAETLGEPLEDPLLLFSVLYGFCVVNFVAFNGDVARDLAAQFLALAEKQRANIPLMVGHRLVGASSQYTGDIVGSSSAFRSGARALRPRQASFAGDAVRSRYPSGSLVNWSTALWMLGYPDAALADVDDALQYAREIGHAPSLMYALAMTSVFFSS